MAHRHILPLPFLIGVACQPDQGLKTFNAEPEAEITSHADGAEVLEGYTESFRGAVSDPDHAAEDLTATWYLDGDVVCESAAPDEDGISLCDVLISATAGQITLEVQDPENAAGSDQISLTVTPTDSPEAEITAPGAWPRGSLGSDIARSPMRPPITVKAQRKQTPRTNSRPSARIRALSRICSWRMRLFSRSIASGFSPFSRASRIRASGRSGVRIIQSPPRTHPRL